MPVSASGSGEAYHGHFAFAPGLPIVKPRMPEPLDKLSSHWALLEKELGRVGVGLPAIERFKSDAGALRFHLNGPGRHVPVVAVRGGTGTGKSTLVNRLLDSNLSATSFRRTYTSAPIAIAAKAKAVPRDWLGLPHETVTETPARGESGKLLVIEHPSPLTEAITLIDTPDLDGDQPAHHAEADRVFRWAQGLVFLVTPEKYQMTELLPYYRLARRYGVAAVFVMNKCEEREVLEDFRRQLAERDWADARVFVLARDDAAYEPPPDMNLEALRSAVTEFPSLLEAQDSAARATALRQRSMDLLGRLRDQIIGPLRDRRREIDRLTGGLRSLTAVPPGVDVAPVTSQLQRRLQEQSVLYLMGPQRIIERVRQVPGLLMRLPRTAWDFFRGNEISLEMPKRAGGETAAPDFPALLADQFTILQSRIDDLVRTSSMLERDGSMLESYEHSKLPSSDASKIAEEELADLKKWLEERWHGTPRDTALLHKVLSVIPGGKALTRWSETAPYLLAIIVATHGAVFGHVDLMIMGSYGLITWLGEKVTNEVAARTRHTNRRIAERFTELAQGQIDRVCQWLETQAPQERELARVERLADELSEL
jgi:hypothetical protein